MIESAQDFVRLRTSDSADEQNRASNDSATNDVWRAVIADFAEMRQWVAHNKTLPVEILVELSRDQDSLVRSAVAMRRKIPEVVQLSLAKDRDETVRERIAYNAKATKRVLEILASDGVDRISIKAKARLDAGDFVD